MLMTFQIPICAIQKLFFPSTTLSFFGPEDQTSAIMTVQVKFH